MPVSGQKPRNQNPKGSDEQRSVVEVLVPLGLSTFMYLCLHECMETGGHIVHFIFGGQGLLVNMQLTNLDRVVVLQGPGTV